MIELKNIAVTFYQKKAQVEAVKNVSLKIAQGEIYGIGGIPGLAKVLWCE